MSHKLLIVDDEPANLRLLERLFRRDFQVITAASGAEALLVLEQQDVALIITDQRMPGMTGIELLKRTASLRPHMVRIILTGYTDIEALVEAINCGQVYRYVTKPWNNDDLRQMVARAVEHYETNKSRHELARTNQRLVSRMKAMTRGFARAIAEALDAKDEYAHGHARRVCGYALAIGRRMGLTDAALEHLSLAAFLHDIGYIGVPDHILLKPGALSAEERAVMRLHPKRGARMLTGIVDMEEVAAAVLHHHEHFDGTGYPNALRDEQIPLLSRIIMVVDAYDAMTSQRPFRATRTHQEALALLATGAGAQFDPEIVSAFAGLEALAKIRNSIADGIVSGGLLTAGHAGDCQLTCEQMAREVATNPILAASVLRAANHISSQPPTASLNLACERIGEAGLRELIAQANTLREPVSDSGYQWEHSLRAAEAARLLAETTTIISPDEAYTLGLLYKLGARLLRALFPEEVEKMVALAEGALCEHESAVFGVDHAQVGAWILEACGLPRVLTTAVQTHLDVLRSNSPVTLLLHVAHAIAQADSPFQVAALDTLGSERLYMLGVNRNDLFRIHACVDSAIERMLDPVC